MPTPPLVLGIGNDYRRDDGAGLIVARRVRAAAPPQVQVREASGDGAALLDAWAGAAWVIVCDAVEAGGAPGTIYRIETAKRPLPSDLFTTSTHAFSLASAIELARTLGRLPGRVTVYGIQGADWA